jgi:uncharacterized cofD-like protein
LLEIEQIQTTDTPNIVVIGGGSGSFTLLQELKYATEHITAIVNMSDDGGSSGVLRDELGVLPPGDVRQCIVALSDNEEVRNLFSYRFGNGKLAGQSTGNIILSALELQHGSFEKAVKIASNLLHITGQVLPVTLGDHRLVMQDGEERIVNERLITKHKITSIDAQVWLDPKAEINPEARQAILDASAVIIAPGNLFSSILPVLSVGGVSEALQATKAKKIAITNLVTKPGQTEGWHVVDYVKAYERYIGVGQLNVVLYNTDLPSKDLLEKYAAEHEYPVATDSIRFSEIAAVAVGKALVAQELYKQDPNDNAIKRTLIWHDARVVTENILRILHG